MSSFSSGQMIGRYRIIELLGAGAMGEVYLAEDPQIERRLAIKTVRLVGRPQEVEDRKLRLSREAKAAGRLIHPSIVTLFDAGEAEGTFFLAFELVEGEDLSELLNRSLTEPSLRPTVGQCLSYVRQTAEGLECAHRQGVVHRDVKPSNLLLTRDGVVKISDFGIAKVAGQATELTTTGTVVGSPFYLSPEQIRGEELDGRSDLFSLGSVLYELLTRRRPFDGETISTLVYQILHTEPKPAWEVSAQLAPAIQLLLQRLLAKDRDHRYATAAEAALAIGEIERALPPEILNSPPPESVPGDQTVILSTSGAFGDSISGPTTGQAALAAGSRPLARPPMVTGMGSPTTGQGAVPGDRTADFAGSGGVASTPGTQGFAQSSASAQSLPPLPPLPPSASPPHSPAQQQVAPPTAAASRPTSMPAPAPAPVKGRGGSRVALVLGIMALAVMAGLIVLYVAVQRFFAPPADPSMGLERTAETIQEDGSELLGNEVGLRVGEHTAEAGGRDLEAAGSQRGTSRQGSALARAEEMDSPASETPREALPTTKPTSDPPARTPAQILADRRAERVERRQEIGQDLAGRQPSNNGPPPVRDGVVDARRSPAGSSSSSSVPAAVDPEPRTASSVEKTSAVGKAAPHQRVETGLRIGLSVTPEDAFVLLDGTLLGRATRFDPRKKGGQALELPGPGTYELKFRSQGMDDYRVEVQAANVLSPTPLAIRLRQADASGLSLGDLEVVRVQESIAFDNAPDDAEIWVDDRRVGRAGDYPGRATRGRTWLELPVGRHRVSVRKNGYRQQDFAVEVSKGAEERRQRLAVQLVRERGS